MFGRLFRKRDDDDWSEAGVRSAEELAALAASNPVVANELETFMRKVVGNEERTLEAHAVSSAKALSGYGIAVSKDAFLEYAKGAEERN